MNGSFFPSAQDIQYYDNSVEKEIKRLPERTKKRFQEFLSDLRSGQIPKTGKNIAHIGNVKKYRLDSRYRVAFFLRPDGTAMITSIGDHPTMKKHLDKVESKTRKHRKSGYTPNV